MVSGKIKIYFLIFSLFLGFLFIGINLSKIKAAGSLSVVEAPEHGFVGLRVYFDVQATDPEGDEVIYEFNWGDRTSFRSRSKPSGDTQSFYHVWHKPGTYEVKITAEDINGNKIGSEIKHHIKIHPLPTQFKLISPPEEQLSQVRDGDELEFKLEVRDKDGNLLREGITPKWSCTPERGNDFFIGEREGVFEVKWSPDHSGKYIIRVEVEPFDKVLFSPWIIVPAFGAIKITASPSATVDLGDTITFSAEAVDEFNNKIEGVEFTWDATEIEEFGVWDAATLTFTADLEKEGSGTLWVQLKEDYLETFADDTKTGIIVTVGKGIGVECQTNEDCRDPEKPYCVNGRCVECRNDGDCEEGELCIKGECRIGCTLEGDTLTCVEGGSIELEAVATDEAGDTIDPSYWCKINWDLEDKTFGNFEIIESECTDSLQENPLGTYIFDNNVSNKICYVVKFTASKAGSSAITVEVEYECEISEEGRLGARGECVTDPILYAGVGSISTDGGNTWQSSTAELLVTCYPDYKLYASPTTVNR